MYEDDAELKSLLKELAHPPKYAADIPDRIQKCELALALVKRDDKPQEWAQLQSELGFSLARKPTHDRVENLQKAIEHYTLAITVYMPDAHATAWAMTQYRLASAYYDLATAPAVAGQVSIQLTGQTRDDNLVKAIKHYENALTTWTRENHPIRWALLQESLGDAYQVRPHADEENLSVAMNYYRKALTELTETDHERDWARIQHQIGTVLLRSISRDRKGNLSQAIKHLKQALAARKRMLDSQPYEWAQTQHNLAMACIEYQTEDRANNIEYAIRLCEEIVARLNAFPEMQALALSTLANAYNRRIRGDRAQNIESAIAYYKRAIDLQRHEPRAKSQHNLAVAYSKRIRGDSLDNLGSAIQAYERALEVFKEEVFAAQRAAVQVDLADAFWHLGNHWKQTDQDEAEKYFKQGIGHGKDAWRVYERLGLSAERARAQYILGNLYAERLAAPRIEHLKEAIRYYEASLAQRSVQTCPVEYAQTLNSLAATYLEPELVARPGTLNLAIQHFHEAIQIHHEHGNREGERRSGANLALLYYGLQDWGKAYDALERVLAVVESMRSEALGDLGQIDIARENSRLYECMMDTCLRMSPKRSAKALIAAEANKARAFLAQMSYEEIPLPLPIESQPRLERERKLARELRGYEDAIRNVETEDERLSLVQQQDGIRTSLNDIWRELEPHAPDYVALRRGDPVEYDQLQALVDGFGAAALVEFYTLPDKIIAFVLRSGEKQPAVTQVPISRDKLRLCVDTYQCEVVEYSQGGDIGQHWQELARPLLADVLPHLQGAKLVYLVPHGLLHYLPLHALRVDGGYLIDRFPIAYAPSTAVLGRVVQRTAGMEQTGNGRGALVFGYTPHEHQREVFEGEAVQIAKFFGTEAHLGKDATGALLREKGVNYNTLHLSCHAFFDPTDPLASGLQLADGVLTARDIMGLKLNADLVTLSACETGINDQQPGDELVGLTRALLYAGASSVLVTLWRVDPMAAWELMRDFYGRLLSKKEGAKLTQKAVALQKAMLEIRKQKPHPYYWAPFVLVGDWR